MPFHLPRRHRRKLLLPPGLLALAGLLWLGCVAVGSWREKLKRRTVVQLTMTPKPDSDTIYHNTYQFSKRIPYLYSQLFTLYHWQNVVLDGSAADDSASLTTIAKTVAAMRADTVPNSGIRVELTPQVRYRTFVQLLDLMAATNQKKYMFDMYHGPFALYILVDEYQHQPIEPVQPQTFCGTMDYHMPTGFQAYNTGYWSTSYLTRIGSWLAALWNPELKNTSWYTSAVGTGTKYDITLRLEKQYLMPFLRSIPHRVFMLSRSEWRILFLLILGMMALSWWKLKRQLQPR
jgi:hypothetical protein